jgi:hypothetical protein
MIAQDNPLLQEPYYYDTGRTTETERLTADMPVKATAAPVCGAIRTLAHHCVAVGDCRRTDMVYRARHSLRAARGGTVE